ncbi:MAG: hypothetical protein U0167_15400 [bacterium]
MSKNLLAGKHWSLVSAAGLIVEMEEDRVLDVLMTVEGLTFSLIKETQNRDLVERIATQVAVKELNIKR